MGLHPSYLRQPFFSLPTLVSDFTFPEVGLEEISLKKEGNVSGWTIEKTKL